MSILETPIADVFADRKLLDRVATALSTDLGVDYLDGLQKLHDGADRARVDGDRTLGGALSWTRSDPDRISDRVMLDQRGAEVVADAERRHRPPVVARDAQGRVLLDKATDIGDALHSDAERERRYQRAKVLDAGYRSDKKRFDRDDVDLLRAGVDLVATLEAADAEQKARLEVQMTKLQVDQILADAGREQGRLKQLEAKLAELDGPLAATRDAGLQHLRTRRSEAASGTLRLLDALGDTEGHLEADVSAEGLKTLDGSSEPIRTMAEYQDELREQVHQRLRELDLPADRFAEILQQIRTENPSLEPVATSGVLGGGPMTNTENLVDTPPGIFGPNHALHQQVQARMAELGRPASAYLLTLNEILAGQG